MGTLKVGTGLKIKRGNHEGREVRLGDIIKGPQTETLVVKLTGNKDGALVGNFVCKCLNPDTDFMRTLQIDLEEFLGEWSNIEVIGNINLV